MKQLRRYWQALCAHPQWWVFGFIVVSTVFMLAIVCYGLPLHLVGDEESLVAGAVTMLEARQLIPVLQPAVFDLLYYPVALPWLYGMTIAGMAVVMRVAAMVSGEPLTLGQLLVSQWSALWVSIRFWSVMAGSLNVWLVYVLARRYWPQQSRRAVMAAWLFGITLLHWQLSVVARHWVFTVLWLLIIMVTAGSMWWRWTVWRAIVVGFFWGSALAVSQLGFFSVILGILTYTLWPDGRSQVQKWRQRSWWFLGGGIVAGAALAVLVHPGAYGFIVSGKASGVGVPMNAISQELVLGFITLWRHEFTLIFLATAATGWCVWYRRWRALLVVGMVAVYELFIAYVHNAPRYHYYVMPFLALLVAYVYDYWWQAARARVWLRVLLVIILCLPLISIGRYWWLTTQATTEQLAASWLNTQAYRGPIVLNSDRLDLWPTVQAFQWQEEYGRARAWHKISSTLPAGTWSRADVVNIHFWLASSTANQVFYVSHQPRLYVETGDGSDWWRQHGRVVQQWTPAASGVDTAEPFDDLGWFNGKLWQWQRFGHVVTVYELAP